MSTTTADTAAVTNNDATTNTTTANTNNDTTTMPPPIRLPLTLIVAATPTLGIGHAGTLPWPQLKQEMAYFARVTKRVPSPSTNPPTAATTPRHNAVIMGRKTWASIPPRFRPLKDRWNVVVTSDPSAVAEEPKEAETDEPDVKRPLTAPSLPAALSHLSRLDAEGRLGRVYVIGGAQLYKSALELPQTRAVLLTRVWREYECDTVFPVDVVGGEGGWVRRSGEELSGFVGEEVREGRVRDEEKGVEFEFCFFEREGGLS